MKPSAKWILSTIGLLATAVLVLLVTDVYSAVLRPALGFSDDEERPRDGTAENVLGTRSRSGRFARLSSSDDLPRNEALALRVRAKGASVYGESANVGPGDTIEVLLRRANLTSMTEESVTLFVALPKYLSPTPAPVRWVYRGRDGFDYEVRIDQQDLFTKQVNFGEWEPNTFFYVRFDLIASDGVEACAATVPVQVRSRSSSRKGKVRANARVRISGSRC